MSEPSQSTGAAVEAFQDRASYHVDVARDDDREVELSVVMPCLNEADTIAVCIGKAQRAMRENGIDGEIVVADNGSTDRSAEIARSLGARVVDVSAPGYGNAL